MQQVCYFLALCDEFSFTRAACRCGVSQPTLTNAISALERELGGALFHRKPSIGLTELGRAVRPYLDEIARNADHARKAAETLSQESYSNASSSDTNRSAADEEQGPRE